MGALVDLWCSHVAAVLFDSFRAGGTSDLTYDELVARWAQ